jgi:membrane-bound lytic murein transglycosylase MltF
MRLPVPKWFGFVFLIALLPADVSSAGVVDAPRPVALGQHLSRSYRDDLTGLLERRYVRVLTTFNKTNFFLSDGQIFGFEYSLMKEYEKFLNKGRGSGELPVVVEFIPVVRDQLVPLLNKGFGDIAAAGLTITKERLRKVDFTDPYVEGVRELVVTHKDTPAMSSVDDLAGREVHVRKSSSYYESLTRLNRALAGKRKEPVRLVAVDEILETEDILELVNSGAIETTVADSHLAGVWADVLPDIRLQKRMELRSGAQIAWMVRKDTPELRSSINAFIRSHRKGTLLGNIYFARYYKKTRGSRIPW